MSAVGSRRVQGQAQVRGVDNQLPSRHLGIFIKSWTYIKMDGRRGKFPLGSINCRHFMLLMNVGERVSERGWQTSLIDRLLSLNSTAEYEIEPSRANPSLALVCLRIE